MRRGGGNYTNPCLTMHQPWASLLVYGIKRIEGRSWPAPVRGRLWIHAASKVPEEETIKAMEEFYREIYAVNGITDIKFPEHYPTSRLLGCIEVVGCLKCDELANWEAVPEGVRLEGQTEFCWLCENPQKLIVPFEMRGFQGVYNLEKKIYESAVRGLISGKGPMPVKFPVPDPRDPFSLKPGSIAMPLPGAQAGKVEKSSTLTAAITGAREAAMQFNKKGQSFVTSTIQSSSRPKRSDNVRGTSFREDKMPQNIFESPADDASSSSYEKQRSNDHGHGRTREDLKQLPGAPSKIFAEAMRGLKQS